MQASEQGLALIRQFEGFSATVYLCPAGKWTIGYGHVVLPEDDFPDEGISQDDAENLLKQDVSHTEKAISKVVEVDINQNQFDAMVSLVYNIGIEAFENSTLLRFLNAGDKDGAAAQFARWDHCGGKVLNGLAARRAAEAELFNAIQA